MTSGVRDDGPVTVASYEWRMDAMLARCRLESCGIACHLTDEWTTSIRWHYTKFLGGIRLQVRAVDAADATAVLNEPPSPAEEPIATEQESAADRLLRAAVFGAVIWPVALYAFWLLLNAIFLGGPWESKERRRIAVASALIVPVVLLPAIAGAAYGLRELFFTP